MYLHKAKKISFTIIKYGKHLYFEVLSNTVYSNQTRMREGECASPLEMCAQCLCFVELVINILRMNICLQTKFKHLSVLANFFCEGI